MKEKTFIENLDLETYRKEILDLLEYDSQDIIFISGSIVEGVGNQYSDLDVYVIKNEFLNMNSHKMDYVSSKSVTQFGQLSNGVGCDIEYWPSNTVMILINKIKNINFEDLTIRTLNQLNIENYSTEELASFIHRFKNGYPIYNEEQFYNLQQQFDLHNFCKLMARKYINSMDNMYEDVIGNLELNRAETALISSRNLLFELMFAYIFSEKQTIDRQKWIFEKLNILSQQNECSKNILYNFKNLYCYTKLNNEKDVVNNVENIIHFSNEVIKIIEKNLGGI